MFFNYIQVFIPIIGLLINVLSQIFIFRYTRRMGLLKSVFLGFSAGFLCVLIIEYYVFIKHPISIIDLIALFIVNILTYLSLGYCYFHFINLGETARRIRILRELSESRKGLSPEEIMGRYNAKIIVEQRIDRLLSNNQIVLKNNRYYIGNYTMLLIAKIIIAMKIMILNKKSESGHDIN